MLKIRVSSLNGRLVRAVSRGQVRYCSVTPKSPESEAASSKRKEFRKIELDMNIMRKLDHMNVGFIPKRKMRVAVAQRLNPHSYRVTDEKKRYGDDDEFQKAVPFPFRGTGKVLHTAANVLDIPTAFPGVPPEIALIGRSNVGKSTLLNALLGFDNSYVQKAIVSDKPGETKYLTFFQLGMSYKPPQKADKKADIASIEEEPEKLVKTPALMFVDMPGYGFAFMSEEEKLRCHMLCLDYLISNPSRNKVLKRVVLLLDGRHGLKASDIMFLQDLQQHLISSVIANSPAQTAADLKRVFPDASAVKSLSTSSTKEGVEADSTAPITISMAAKTTKLLSQHLGWKLQIVLTKCDLVDRPELCRRIIDVSRTVSEKLPALYHSMLPTLALSAMQLRGVQEMQRDLAALVPPKWEGAPNNRKPEPESVESEKAFFKDTKSDLPHNRGKYASADRKADPVAGASKPNKWTKQTAEQNERLSFSERRKQREQELTGKVSEDCAPSRRATSNKSENTKETVKPDINTASSYSIKERIVPAKVFNAKVFNEATVAAPSPAAPPQAKASHQTSQQAAPVAAAAATKFTGKNPTPSTLTPPTPTATTSSNSSSQGQGKGKGKPVKAPRVAKKKHKLLEDYRDELDEYFGDDNLDMDELMDSDGFGRLCYHWSILFYPMLSILPFGFSMIIFLIFTTPLFLLCF